MRNWVRERMKRRKKNQPSNETEATGKVGQQKPPVDALHPEPIVPAYHAETTASAGDSSAAATRKRPEIEVQPESPSTPPAGTPEQKPAQAAKSTRPSKGVVVLA